MHEKNDKYLREMVQNFRRNLVCGEYRDQCFFEQRYTRKFMGRRKYERVRINLDRNFTIRDNFYKSLSVCRINSRFFFIISQYNAEINL